MSLFEEAKTCKDCKCWLKHCHSECCKRFTIPDAKFLKPVKNEVLSVSTRQNSDMQKYFKLHSCSYNIVLGVLNILVKDFEWVNNDLHILNQCNWLSNEGLCKHYSKRPIICKMLNNKTKHSKSISLTPNCLFKFKE